MRTPACARRTFAGARSPVRASSLPAMWSCVSSTARPPSSSAMATPAGPPTGSNDDDVTLRRHAAPCPAARRPRRARRRRRRRRSRGGPAANRCTARPPRRRATSVAPVRISAPARTASAASHSTRAALGPATPASPPVTGSRSTIVTWWPRRPATRATSRPAGPPPTTTTSRGRRAGRVPVRVLRLPTGGRLADARHDRVADVAHLARLVAPRARPDPLRACRRAAWRRDRGRRSGRGSSRRRHSRRRRTACSACSTSTIDPWTITGTSTAAATDAARSRLNPIGWWKSGRVCSTEKMAPRTTTR